MLTVACMKQWAKSNVTSDSSPDECLDIQASSAVSAVFFSTGMTEILLSPIAGMVADLWGLDSMGLDSIWGLASIDLWDWTGLFCPAYSLPH